MRLRKSLSVALLPLFSATALADVDYACYPLFEEAGAVPLTQSCKLEASFADTGLGMYHCTAGTEHIDAYCGDTCYASMVTLHNSPVYSSLGLNTFVVQQDCIGQDSCKSKMTMEDTSWLDKVVPDFIEPFANQSAGWPEIRQQCDEAALISAAAGNQSALEGVQLICSARAAQYHINQDLLKSLKTNGCGTEGDWQKVAQILIDCIDKNPKLGGLNGIIAKRTVLIMRDSVRSQCQSASQLTT